MLKEERNKMISEKSNHKIKVEEVPLGNRIIVTDCNGGETWTAIAHQNKSTIFLLDKEYEIQNVKFGKTNNYMDSNARSVSTTCDPVQRIIRVLTKDAFVPLEIDLFSHDGFRDYGVCKGDITGSMTYDLYRYNRKYINPSDILLATPDSTPSGIGASYVRHVDSRGRVSRGSCGWCGKGVRPFCIIKFSIFVYCDL